MKESIAQFGPGNLTGIFTQPEMVAEEAPIAIIINAGIVHRVGPFRLHVDLSRGLAELGIPSLRMDLSGLGDSPTRQGKFDDQSRAYLDVSDAMDHLQSLTGGKRFVLIGLCSGAFNAHQIAKQDSRVVGAVFLDGIVFRTLGFYFRHYVLRMFKPRVWRNAIKRRMQGELIAADSEGGRLGESEYFSNDLDRNEVAAELSEMLDRGVEMLFLYTDGYDDISSRSQFQEMFGIRPGHGQVQVEFYPNATHTFRLTENREVACNRIVDWFRQRFPIAASTSESKLNSI